MNKKSLYRPIAICVLILSALSCGEPLGPLSNSWQKVTGFGEGVYLTVGGLAVAGGDVYAALTRPGTPKELKSYPSELAVVAYRGGRLEDDWVLPDAGARGNMCDIGKINSALWAGGTRTEDGETFTYYFPVFIRNTGFGWHEVDLGSKPGFGGIGRVYPVSEEVCWLLTGEEDPGPWYGSLVLYDNGALRKFPAFTDVTAAYDAETETLFVIPDREGSAAAEVAITTDRGSSWIYEKAVLKAIPGADVEKAGILPPIVYRNDLYFALRPTISGGWTAIYRRTGAPGAGKYELVFFANLGPYFRFVDEFATDDTRLMAIGTDTCLLYDGERWQMERLPYEHTSFNGLGAAPTGFYATARNETTEELELLFHP
jgi:hypothetical protein